MDIISSWFGGQTWIPIVIIVVIILIIIAVPIIKGYRDEMKKGKKKSKK